MDIITSSQSALYKCLNDNSDLLKLLKGIYSCLPNNSTLPYIYLGDVFVKDKSTNSNSIFLITNQIHIYSDDKTKKNILEIYEQLGLALKIFKLSDHNLIYKYLEEASLKHEDKIFEMICIYKILIEQKT